MRKLTVSAAFLALGLLLGGGATALATDVPDDPDRPHIRTTAGIRWLAETLQLRERELDQREATIELREAELALAEDRLRDRLESLASMRDDLRAQTEHMEREHEQRVLALVRMFEGMRARDAARILDVTEEEVAMVVLARMGRARAGRILGEMPPKSAARLTASIKSDTRLRVDDDEER